MVSLQNKPNVYPPDPNYTNGDIKDADPGISNGTPVNRLVYADMHQFFEQLMQAGGVSANNVPDNDLNGYQLIEALLAAIDTEVVDKVWKVVGTGGQPAFQHSWANAGAGDGAPVRFRLECAGRMLRICGVVSGGSTGTIIFTLPGGYIPLYSTTKAIVPTGGYASCSIQVHGQSSGQAGQVQIDWTVTSNVDIDCVVPMD